MKMVVYVEEVFKHWPLGVLENFSEVCEASQDESWIQPTFFLKKDFPGGLAEREFSGRS